MCSRAEQKQLKAHAPHQTVKMIKPFGWAVKRLQEAQVQLADLSCRVMKLIHKSFLKVSCLQFIGFYSIVQIYKY